MIFNRIQSRLQRTLVLDKDRVPINVNALIAVHIKPWYLRRQHDLLEMHSNQKSQLPFHLRTP